MKIEETNTITLLGIAIDRNFNYEEDTSELCKKLSMKLDAVNLLQEFKSEGKKRQLYTSSFFQTSFNFPVILVSVRENHLKNYKKYSFLV